jgi:phage terminase small subunit
MCLLEIGGLMSKTQAAKEAGYNSTTKNGLSEMASKLTNVNKNPHVVRYLEKKLANEEQKYNNKLRSFKRFEKFGDDAAVKHQYAAAINSEYRSGQLAGLYVDKKEITHNMLEGMSRDQLEKRLSELEEKIGEAKNIIDITPEKKLLRSKEPRDFFILFNEVHNAHLEQLRSNIGSVEIKIDEKKKDKY